MSVQDPAPCSAWATLAQLQACHDVTGIAAGVTTQALNAASDVLWRLSGFKYPGVCTDTVRPCAQNSYIAGTGSCDYQYGWGYSSWWSWMPAWGFCSCNANPHRACGCSTISEIRLGRAPILTVTAVKQDGVLLPGTAYHIDDAEWLVRIDGGSWPCFPAGTRVLTDRGLKAIETIEAGERVLTHRNRWRTVTRSGKTGDSETVLVTGRGGSVRSTPDHRFWGAEVAGRPGNRKMGQPEWVRADGLLGHAWATPAAIEPLPIPLPEGWANEDIPAGFWWMVGRWIGDGWTSTSTADPRVTICCNKDETEALGKRLDETGWLWRRSEESTVMRFRTANRPLRGWLREHFGSAAATKQIPAWLLGAPDAIKRALVDGYVSADGWRGQRGHGRPFTSIHTTGRDLALGLRLLVATLGEAPLTYEGRQTTSEIEGRTIRGAEITYRVDWPDGKPGEPYSQAWADGEHLWGRVRSVDLDETVVPVYDLEVEDDHSFVAEGFVVHNCCQDLTKADTAADTFSVAFTWGRNPPASGVSAAIDLAWEYVKTCADGDCAPNERASSITRQGTSIQMIAPERFGYDSFDNVRLGIKSVDRFLLAVGTRKPAFIVSPDIDSDVRRVNT